MEGFWRVGQHPRHGPERDPSETESGHKDPQHPEPQEDQDVHRPAKAPPLHVLLNAAERAGTTTSSGVRGSSDHVQAREGERADKEESHEGHHQKVLGGSALPYRVVEELVDEGARLGGRAALILQILPSELRNLSMMDTLGP